MSCHFNAEGISRSKSVILITVPLQNKANVLPLQGTPVKVIEKSARDNIPGIKIH